MDDELDNELCYYGEVCELFDETVEAEFSGFVEDDDEVLEVESEDEIFECKKCKRPCVLPPVLNFTTHIVTMKLHTLIGKRINFKLK